MKNNNKCSPQVVWRPLDDFTVKRCWNSKKICLIVLDNTDTNYNPDLLILPLKTAACGQAAKACTMTCFTMSLNHNQFVACLLFTTRLSHQYCSKVSPPLSHAMLCHHACFLRRRNWAGLKEEK